MRAVRFLAPAILVLGLVSCKQTGLTYDPAEPIVFTVKASEDLNQYDAGSHTVRVYVFRLTDPNLFMSADLSGLTGESGTQVQGGVVHDIRTFRPGEEDPAWKTPGTGLDQFEWIGVYALYRDASGSRRAYVEIPRSGELTLSLGAKSFTLSD